VLDQKQKVLGHAHDHRVEKKKFFLFATLWYLELGLGLKLDLAQALTLGSETLWTKIFTYLFILVGPWSRDYYFCFLSNTSPVILLYIVFVLFENVKRFNNYNVTGLIKIKSQNFTHIFSDIPPLNCPAT